MTKFLFLATALIIGNFVNAQSYSWWNWSEYNLKFKTPENFILISNNADEFKAENNRIGFKVYPRKGERLSYQEMKSSLLDWAGRNDLILHSDPVYISNINGYWGVGLDATYHGASVSLFLLIDPDFPHISFYVWFDYRYARDADVCLSILRSFTPYEYHPFLN